MKTEEQSRFLSFQDKNPNSARNYACIFAWIAYIKLLLIDKKAPLSMTFKPLRLNSTLLALLLAVHFALLLNMAIFRHIYEIFMNLEHYNVFFLLSIPVFFVTVLNILFLPFTIKYFEKPFFIFLIITASLVNFAMFQYRVVFDPNMIDNVFSTNFAEASSYSNLTFFIWFGLTGLLPAILLFLTKITHFSFLKDVAVKGGSLLASILIILILAAFFYKDYASVIRNNSNLRKEVVPYYYVVSTVKFIKKTYFHKTLPYKYVGLDATKKPSKKKDLLVVIVGETARSMNYELNGYDRPTNAHSRDIKNLIAFQNATSCGTATAVSLPCMMSFLERKNYSKAKFKAQDNITDVLKRAGITTLWFDNNTGAQGVTHNIDYVSIPRKKSKFCDGTICTDDYFIDDLQKEIDIAKNNDAVIFIHILGSHGPTYYKRYPESHKKFQPDCPKSDIQNCSDEEIVNSYDNTILFTDYVMAEIIKILKNKNNTSKYNTSMIYMSDHGESLGENGLYLHGMPYAVAPKEQTHVPLITWFSDKTVKNKKINMKCLKKYAKAGNFSHDNLTHTILGLMDIQTEAYKADMDILKNCRR